MDDTVFDDAPLFKFAYEQDIMLNAEVSVAYHEFEDERDVFVQINAYNGHGESGAFQNMPVFESYKYAVAVKSGRYLIGGDRENPSDMFRVAECNHYRNAFRDYYKPRPDGSERKIPMGDMVKLASLGGRMGIDLLLYNQFQENAFTERGMFEFDPLETPREGDFVDYSLRFLLRKDEDFNPLIHKRRANVVTSADETLLDFDTIMTEACTITRPKHSMIHCAQDNKLLTISARLM